MVFKEPELLSSHQCVYICLDPLCFLSAVDTVVERCTCCRIFELIFKLDLCQAPELLYMSMTGLFCLPLLGVYLVFLLLLSVCSIPALETENQCWINPAVC